jgi:protein involved in polysaccharide export with SLBB domain
MKHITFFILIVVMVTGCRTRGPSFDPLSPEGGMADAEENFTAANVTNRLDKSLLKASTDPYRLGPGDIIDVEVIGELKSQILLAVGPDGKIYYSLLPGTSVWGLSLAETRALLQRELTKYTRATPELVINLRFATSKRVWLLGAVPAPGVYTLAAPTTLLDALLASGGNVGDEGESQRGESSRSVSRSARQPEVAVPAFDQNADFARSFVLRNGKRLPVDFDRLLKHGDLTQNIYLEPDDFVFIRPNDLPGVYILGAVGAPQIIPYSRDLTVAGAVISAGGAIKYSMPGRIAVIRGGLTEPKIAEVDYQSIVTGKARNVRLEPGDIVYVPYSPLRRVSQLAEDILDQFVRTVAVNEGSYVIDRNRSAVPISAPGFSGSGGTQ